jgi:hypothetical protein
MFCMGSVTGQAVIYCASAADRQTCLSLAQLRAGVLQQHIVDTFMQPQQLVHCSAVLYSYHCLESCNPQTSRALAWGVFN